MDEADIAALLDDALTAEGSDMVVERLQDDGMKTVDPVISENFTVILSAGSLKESLLRLAPRHRRHLQPMTTFTGDQRWD